MDEKCVLLLNDILEEVFGCFGEIKCNYHRTQNVRDYIENLGKLTEVIMFIRTASCHNSLEACAAVLDTTEEEST